MFRFFFQGDPFSQASRSVARGALAVGLLLIGFGMLVFVLRDLFAFLAAAIFFMAGFSAIAFGLRILLGIWLSNRRRDPYRHNVRVRDPFDPFNP
jgi:hypothetical protein